MQCSGFLAVPPGEGLFLRPGYQFRPLVELDSDGRRLMELSGTARPDIGPGRVELPLRPAARCDLPLKLGGPHFALRGQERVATLALLQQAFFQPFPLWLKSFFGSGFLHCRGPNTNTSILTILKECRLSATA